MKFSWDKRLNISFSIYLREFFFWRMLYRAFSIMIFSSFDTHIFRRRKTFRNLCKRVLNTSDLKFFSVHSSKSSWNCSHNFLFVRWSCSHSLIFVSIHFSQFWIFVFIQLWLRSDFARVTTCEIERCFDCEAILQKFDDSQRSCAGWICPDCGTARIWSAEIQKKRSPNQVRTRATAAKIVGLIEIGVRENKSSIKPVFCLLIARFRLISGENLIKYDMWIWSDFITK